jgi:glycosyltransferase involved in cell wall biosynthesis
MQKIIFLSPIHYFKGGAERSLFDLMNNPNIFPILVSPDNGELSDKAKTLGILVHILPFRSINTIKRPFSFIKGFMALLDLYRTAKQLNKIAQQEKVTIIHSNGLKAHAINCTARLIGKTKAVLHIRDIPYTKAEKLVWYILYVLSNNFIIVSKACWCFKKIPEKVKIVYNGTPLIERGIQNPTHNPVTIGFIGRIHPAKGLHLLLNWLAKACSENIDVKLTIRGEFSDDAPDYEHQIKQQIQQLNLNSVVEFKGFIASPELVYDGVDIVVVPSEIPDPLPRSVMEAMARKIPVFGYPAGGIGEMILDYKTGFMVSDVQSFIKALNFVIQNPDKTEIIRQAGLQHIRTHFSMDNLHQKIYNIYTNIAIAH